MTVEVGGEKMRERSEALARFFHETYEELAPSFGYATRKASRVPWDEVPEQNRALMVAVAERVLEREKLVPYENRDEQGRPVEQDWGLFEEGIRE